MALLPPPLHPVPKEKESYSQEVMVKHFTLDEFVKMFRFRHLDLLIHYKV